MLKNTRKNVIPQMFDVRPVDRSGVLDWERIRSVGGGDIPDRHIKTEDKDGFAEAGSGDSSYEVDRFESDTLDGADRVVFPGDDGRYAGVGEPASASGPGPVSDARTDVREPLSVRPEDIPTLAVGLFRDMVVRFRFGRRFVVRTFPIALVLGCVLVGFVSGGKVASVRGRVLGESTEGMNHVSVALDGLSRADFETSSRNFREARDAFSSASDSLGTIGRALARAAGIIPPLSRVSSGQALLEGAEHLSVAGEQLSRIASLLSSSTVSDGGDGSLLSVVGAVEEAAGVASKELGHAEEAFSRVDPEDVPESERDTFLSVRDRLSDGRAVLDGFREHSFLIRELLGENGPRLYLFLFQNNHELRPTGGFIGSYGLLSIRNGRVENLLVDGIFNPDGQFRENIVPPRPMRKMTVAWSLHDSNWWPDFPTSARKAVSFYEKTGGPTVDGIVALTPVVLRDMLRVTGPIDMPEYGVTVDADNFMPVIQEEVEVNYDRDENRPKKILSDLTPILIDRLTSSRDPETLLPVLQTLSDALSERQILLYSRNEDIESLLSRAGWSGGLLPTDGDYASVVHTNINGFKTDGVIENSVEHSSDIRADGSVVDTIRITRRHTGGDTGYDWWDRVNSDYMRVYVPRGSELLSVSGATYEFIDDPVDYEALGFSRDPDLERDEEGTIVDESGTRVSEESGKTVFGNWVYVSPGESVTVEYTYLLPFRVFPESADDPASYSFLFQKQAGLEELGFRHTLSYPDRFVPVWHSDGTEKYRDGLSFSGTIRADAYSGVVFTRP